MAGRGPALVDKVDLAVGHRAGIIPEPGAHEAVGAGADVGAVGVATETDLGVEAVAGPVERVDPFEGGGHPFIGTHREDRIGVAVDEQQRPGGDERGDPCPGPLKGVDEEHAVAVAVDAAVGDVGRQIGHPAHRHRCPHPLVGRGDPQRRRAAAADPRDADPLAVDIGPCGEEIDGADPVPAFDAGRRVAARLPPPPPLAVGAMVGGGDLAELEGVEDEADVAVAGEPQAVILEGGLIAVAAAAGVAAEVDDGRMPRAGGGGRRAPQVRRHVQAGDALVMQILDDEAIPLVPARDGRAERRPRRQRIEPEHEEVFGPELRLPRRVARPEVGGDRTLDPRRAGGEPAIDHRVSRCLGVGVPQCCGVGGGLGADDRRREEEREEREERGDKTQAGAPRSTRAEGLRAHRNLLDVAIPRMPRPACGTLPAAGADRRGVPTRRRKQGDRNRSAARLAGSSYGTVPQPIAAFQ